MKASRPDIARPSYDLLTDSAIAEIWSVRHPDIPMTEKQAHRIRIRAELKIREWISAGAYGRIARKTDTAATIHRDNCARDLGFSDELIDDICDCRIRGSVTAFRQRLVVAMRDTPTEGGVKLSWHEIAGALNSPGHTTMITAYQRAKSVDPLSSVVACGRQVGTSATR